MEIENTNIDTLRVHALRNTASGRTFLRSASRNIAADRYEVRRQKYDSKRSKNASAEFLGWDGEGAEVNGRHVYTLLANSSGAFIESPTGLTTAECLEFLIEQSVVHADKIHVIYGGGYDANMILGDLSYLSIVRLADTGQVDIDDYTISYRARKSLTITKRGGWGDKGKRTKTSTITIWDTIGFFQSRFTEAVSKWLPHVDLNMIAAMKERRGTFTHDDATQVREYCISECQTLAELMTELRAQCAAVGYIPNRWDGSGALAAKALTVHNVKDYMSTKNTDPILQTDAFKIARRSAYFGGRIECVRTGDYDGYVWAHDITSAYPAAMEHLTCLACGSWKRMLPPMGWRNDGDIRLYRIEFDYPLTPGGIYPFPVRKDGRVYFPHKGSGWYWHHEVEGIEGMNVTILECYEYTTTCSHKPFAFVRRDFESRRELKRMGHPAEKALKLLLNSIYGKITQRAGWKIRKDGTLKLPPFHDLVWSGLITSETRAKVYKIALRDPDAVIAFETDGIYAMRELVSSTGGDLGGWDVAQYHGITYVRSGVYWVKDGLDNWHAKYRGMDRDSLRRDDVIQGWMRGDLNITALQTRFRGMYTSVQGDRFPDWRQWITETRDIRLEPDGKRRHEICWCRPPSVCGTMHITTAVPVSTMSDPYHVPWESSPPNTLAVKADLERLGLDDDLEDD